MYTCIFRGAWRNVPTAISSVIERRGSRSIRPGTPTRRLPSSGGASWIASMRIGLPRLKVFFLEAARPPSGILPSSLASSPRSALPSASTLTSRSRWSATPRRWTSTGPGRSGTQASTASPSASSPSTTRGSASSGGSTTPTARCARSAPPSPRASPACPPTSSTPSPTSGPRRRCGKPTGSWTRGSCTCRPTASPSSRGPASGSWPAVAASPWPTRAPPSRPSLRSTRPSKPGGSPTTRSPTTPPRATPPATTSATGGATATSGWAARRWG